MKNISIFTPKGFR